MGFIFVALGGALGAMARYAISLIPVKTQFPRLTLITNILGAVLIGFIVGIADKKGNVAPRALLFWKTEKQIQEEKYYNENYENTDEYKWTGRK